MLTLGPEICHSESCTRPGCSPKAGCQGHAIREIAPEIVREQAERLKADANRWGVAFSFTVGEHPAPAAPSDEKWVPLEPTKEMLSAARMVEVIYPGRGYQDHRQSLKEHEAKAVWNAMLSAAPASLESGLVGVTMEPLSANLPRELMESYLAVAQEETFKGFSESVIKDQITRLHETVYRMGFECGWRVRQEIAARAVPGEPT